MIRALEEKRPDLVLLDVRLPGIGGFDVCRGIKQRPATRLTPVVHVILRKPSKLTSAEYDVMKQHTVIGERLCGELRSLAAVRPIVRHYHEPSDGSGYPDGLRGDDIPLLAQIVGIVDAYDAITTTRPYRVALPTAHAYEELTRDTAAGLLREDLVHEFIGLGRAGTFDAIAAGVQSRAPAALAG